MTSSRFLYLFVFYFFLSLSQLNASSIGEGEFLFSDSGEPKDVLTKLIACRGDVKTEKQAFSIMHRLAERTQKAKKEYDQAVLKQMLLPQEEIEGEAVLYVYGKDNKPIECKFLENRDNFIEQALMLCKGTDLAHIMKTNYMICFQLISLEEMNLSFTELYSQGGSRHVSSSFERAHLSLNKCIFTWVNKELSERNDKRFMYNFYDCLNAKPPFSNDRQGLEASEGYQQARACEIALIEFLMCEPTGNDVKRAVKAKRPEGKDHSPLAKRLLQGRSVRKLVEENQALNRQLTRQQDQINDFYAHVEELEREGEEKDARILELEKALKEAQAKNN